jgi:nucleoside-diphosphate-sugar epimerase
VTGAAGFIGSHLVEALATAGAEVTALDDLSNGDWRNLDGVEGDIDFVIKSVTADDLADVLHGCRYVFHQAAWGSVPRSVEEPVAYHQNNTIGTTNLLEASREAGVERVVYAGSSSAYGDPPDSHTPKSEDMQPDPLSPYASSKLAGEHAMRAWAKCYGIDTVTLRYFNIFGPRQNANSAYAAVIAAFARDLTRGKRPTIFGDGQQSRDFTYMANAVHANLLAARHPQPLQGQVFNVATGNQVSVNKLFERMAVLLGGDGTTPFYDSARPGDVRHSLADIQKAGDTLGYEPLVDFDSGLSATVEWYQREYAEVA